jgi:hypothetical protein
MKKEKKKTTFNKRNPTKKNTLYHILKKHLQSFN